MKYNLIHRLGNYKTIIQNAGYLSIIEVIRLAMPFVALPYIIKTVGTSNYGLTVFAQTIMSYFTILINWGLDVSAVKEVSVNRDNKNKLNKIVSAVLGIKSILLLLSFGILILCIIFIPFVREHFLLFIFAFLSCFSEVLFPIWFYQGIEKMKYLTIIRTISILFYTICVFIFIKENDDYIIIVLLQSLGNILSGLVSLYILFAINKIRLEIPSIKFMIHSFKEAFPFFMSRLSVIFNNSMAKTLSGLFFTMEAVAAFDLAQKIATASLIPTQMINQAIYPHIANTKSISFVNRYLRIDILLSLTVAIGVALIAPYAIDFFSKGQLEDSVILLRILCIWVFFCGITTYVGSPVLVSFGYPKPFNRSVILATITLSTLYFICYVLKIFTIYNFAWMLVISELVVLLYRMYYCVKFKLII